MVAQQEEPQHVRLLQRAPAGGGRGRSGGDLRGGRARLHFPFRDGFSQRAGEPDVGVFQRCDRGFDAARRVDRQVFGRRGSGVVFAGCGGAGLRAQRLPGGAGDSAAGDGLADRRFDPRGGLLCGQRRVEPYRGPDGDGGRGERDASAAVGGFVGDDGGFFVGLWGVGDCGVGGFGVGAEGEGGAVFGLSGGLGFSSLWFGRLSPASFLSDPFTKG